MRKRKPQLCCKRYYPEQRTHSSGCSSKCSEYEVEHSVAMRSGAQLHRVRPHMIAGPRKSGNELITISYSESVQGRSPSERRHFRVTARDALWSRSLLDVTLAYTKLSFTYLRRGSNFKLQPCCIVACSCALCVVHSGIETFSDGANQSCIACFAKAFGHEPMQQRRSYNGLERANPHKHNIAVQQPEHAQNSALAAQQSRA